MSNNLRPSTEAQTSVLPALISSAPGGSRSMQCPGGCSRGRSGQQATPMDDVNPAFENKALPAPFLVAPGCGNNCRRATVPMAGAQEAPSASVIAGGGCRGTCMSGAQMLLAGGGPTTVRDARSPLRRA
jgi:hypothetical protein